MNSAALRKPEEILETLHSILSVEIAQEFSGQVPADIEILYHFDIETLRDYFVIKFMRPLPVKKLKASGDFIIASFFGHYQRLLKDQQHFEVALTVIGQSTATKNPRWYRVGQSLT